jgi:hypothetical protein
MREPLPVNSVKKAPQCVVLVACLLLICNSLWRRQRVLAEFRCLGKEGNETCNEELKKGCSRCLFFEGYSWVVGLRKRRGFGLIFEGVFTSFDYEPAGGFGFFC